MMRNLINIVESQQVQLSLSKFERPNGDWWINISGSDGKHYGACQPEEDGTFLVYINMFHPKTGQNLGSKQSGVKQDDLQSTAEYLFAQSMAKLPSKAEQKVRAKAPAYDGQNEGDILRHHDEEGSDFAVLHHDATRHDAETPLVIVIHPGDMIETNDGYDWREAEKVMQFAQENQEGTAAELAHWRDQGYDIAVLHRGSCSFMVANGKGHEDYRSEVLSAWDNGTTLFGDDLGQAAKWMIENLHVEVRPHIYLAGAYSTPGNGCLTFIGKAIEKVVGEDKITVSDWSPPGNAADRVWRPGNRKVKFWDAQGDGWRKTPKGRDKK